jgi:hypothetical protein
LHACGRSRAVAEAGFFPGIILYFSAAMSLARLWRDLIKAEALLDELAV